MQKIMILTASIAMLLSACSTMEKSKISEKVGLANPASQFCVEQGGRLTLKTEAEGQVGYCTLPSGQTIEEWEYFHSQHRCIASEAEKLVGHKKLSEDEVKKRTHATAVRMLEPNQPMTLDYREDRITITFDPKTGIVQRASCG